MATGNPIRFGFGAAQAAGVLEHPRLVGPWTPALEALARQYLEESRAFTVVLPPVRPFIDATGTLRPTPTEILAALAVQREDDGECPS
jgi:hypothetical protein